MTGKRAVEQIRARPDRQARAKSGRERDGEPPGGRSAIFRFVTDWLLARDGDRLAFGPGAKPGRFKLSKLSPLRGSLGARSTRAAFMPEKGREKRAGTH